MKKLTRNLEDFSPINLSSRKLLNHFQTLWNSTSGYYIPIQRSIIYRQMQQIIFMNQEPREWFVTVTCKEKLTGWLCNSQTPCKGLAVLGPPYCWGSSHRTIDHLSCDAGLEPSSGTRSTRNGWSRNPWTGQSWCLSWPGPWAPHQKAQSTPWAPALLSSMEGRAQLDWNTCSCLTTSWTCRNHQWIRGLFSCRPTCVCRWPQADISRTNIL